MTRSTPDSAADKRSSLVDPTGLATVDAIDTGRDSPPFLLSARIISPTSFGGAAGDMPPAAPAIVASVDASLPHGQGQLPALGGHAMAWQPWHGDAQVLAGNPPGVNIIPSPGRITAMEGGPTGSYLVQLNAAPTANVTITLNVTNGQVTTDVGTLTFTPDNWNAVQKVTVTAIDDTVNEGAHTGVILHTLSSADTRYDGLRAGPVRLAIADNDLTTGGPLFGLDAPVSSPFGLGSYRELAFGDLDADGDLDVIGTAVGAGVFFRNTGSASAPAFANEGNAWLPGAAEGKPTLGDIDGDGDLDMFAGNFAGDTLFFRNTGSASAPSFTPEGMKFGLFNLGNYSSPTLVDIDADGDLDLFNVTGVSAIRFFRNTGDAGAPTFKAEQTTFGLPGGWAINNVDFADIDGDSDLDAFIGGRFGTNFFRNNGSADQARFTEERLEFGLPNPGAWTDPAFADIDADGDIDALISHLGGLVFVRNHFPGVAITQSGGATAVSEGGTADTYTVALKSAPTADVVIALNPTNGQVSALAATPLLVFTPDNWDQPQFVTVSARDDGVGEGLHAGAIVHTVSSVDEFYNGLVVAPVRVTITDDDLLPGDPSFGSAVINPAGLADVGFSASPVFADIDGDGDLDAFVGESDGHTHFFRNTGDAGTPVFAAEGTGPFGLPDVGASAAPTFADIDGDGDLDALVGDNLLGALRFFRNTGNALAPTFAEASNFGLTDTFNTFYSPKPTFADIDSDGDLDLFLGESGGGTYFFRNTGSPAHAAFTAEGEASELRLSGSGSSPAFFDIDGDSDLDAFIGGHDGTTQFFRNTGSPSTPVFSAEGHFGLPDVGDSAAPTFADLDADGDLDAWIGANDGSIRFFENYSAFSLQAPETIRFTDTAFDDRFASVTRQLVTTGAETATLSYGISGGTDDGSTSRLTGDYGTLVVTKATGMASFMPDDSAIETLGEASSLSFTVTVTNGSATRSQALVVGIEQSGSTETAGNDSLTGTVAAERFDAGAGDDTVDGGGGRDTLAGGEGHDNLYGGSANDTLRGGGGNDLIDGGTGSDRMEGGAGDDTYRVDLATDRVIEAPGEGVDSVRVSLTTYTLGRDLENLYVDGPGGFAGTGNSAANRLHGGTGSDTLSGASGADTLWGGGGLDVLAGGFGRDSFVFDTTALGPSATHAVTIQDFSRGAGDRIDLRPIDADAARAGDQSFLTIDAEAFSGTARELRWTAFDTYTLIQGDVDGNGVADLSIVLAGNTAPVDAGWFNL